MDHCSFSRLLRDDHEGVLQPPGCADLLQAHVRAVLERETGKKKVFLLSSTESNPFSLSSQALATAYKNSPSGGGLTHNLGHVVTAMEEIEFYGVRFILILKLVPPVFYFIKFCGIDVKTKHAFIPPFRTPAPRPGGPLKNWPV